MLPRANGFQKPFIIARFDDLEHDPRMRDRLLNLLYVNLHENTAGNDAFHKLYGDLFSANQEADHRVHEALKNWKKIKGARP